MESWVQTNNLVYSGSYNALTLRNLQQWSLEYRERGTLQTR
jgi:hypothetical protein